ncbi:MAG: DUF898 family protein, partial [Anderseniella sp.]
IGAAVGLYYVGAFDWLEAFFKSIEASNSETDVMKGVKLIGLVLALLFLLLIFASLRSIIWSFYTAKELNLFTAYTRFSGATFQFNATAWSLITLWLGNMALIIFTLGIASPFVEQRIMRYFTDRLVIDGNIDFAAIQQSQAKLESRGEGLIDALDLDAF